jgi:hypothetical protein
MSLPLLQLVSARDLAEALGFAAPNDAFRGFCRNIGITPVRRNPNFYDPKLVRVRLDQAQGMVSTDPKPESSSLVEQRRARLGTA